MSEALKILIPEEEKRELSRFLRASDTPAWEYWEEFVEHRHAFEKSPTTTRSVRDTLRRLAREKHIVSIQDLNNPRVIEDSLRALKDKHGFVGSTYNAYRKNTLCYLIWLEKRDLIDEIKTRKVEKFKTVVPPQPTLKKHQVQTVIAHLNMNNQTTLLRLRNLAFMHILFVIGARPSEIEKLTMKSIRKEGSKWLLEVIGSKNISTRRPYELPAHAKDALMNYLAYREKIGRSEPFLFISRRQNKAWTSKGMRAFLKKVSKKVGFQVGLRSSRRYVATVLAENGIPLERIADHLGHKRTSTTKSYIEQSGILTREGMGVLGKITQQDEDTPLENSQNE